MFTTASLRRKSFKTCTCGYIELKKAWMYQYFPTGTCCSTVQNVSPMIIHAGTTCLFSFLCISASFPIVDSGFGKVRTHTQQVGYIFKFPGLDLLIVTISCDVLHNPGYGTSLNYFLHCV